MILRLIHPGSPTRGPLEAAAADYRARLAHYHRVEERFLKASKHADTALALAEEAVLIAGSVRDRDRLIALDAQATSLSSEQLAKRLAAWMQGGYGAVIFALGSARGLDPSVCARADERLAFGPMTLPHDLARVVLWEQLYRAATILRGEPYHK